jgi:hypothetical protein
MSRSVRGGRLASARLFTTAASPRDADDLSNSHTRQRVAPITRHRSVSGRARLLKNILVPDAHEQNYACINMQALGHTP